MAETKSPDVGPPLWPKDHEKLHKDLMAQEEFKDAGYHLEAGDTVILDDQQYEVVDFRQVRAPAEHIDLGVPVPVESDEPIEQNIITENKIVVRSKKGGGDIMFNLSEFLEKVKK